MPDDRAVYCVEGCGRPAETSRPHAITRDGEPTTDLVCWQCADAAEWMHDNWREAVWGLPRRDADA